MAHGPQSAGTTQLVCGLMGRTRPPIWLVWVGPTRHDFYVGRAGLARWPVMARSISGRAGLARPSEHL